MNYKPMIKSLGVLLVVYATLVDRPTAYLQGATQIEIGQEVFGQVALQNPSAAFTFTPDTNGPVTLTVQTLTPNFAPFLLVYNAADERIARQTNPAGLPLVRLTLSAQSNTTYTVYVLGVGGESGEFRLALSTTTNLGTLNELLMGQGVQDRVTPEANSRRYQFASDPTTAMILTLKSSLPDSGPAFILRDMDERPIAMAQTSILGTTLTLPPAAGLVYEIEILHSGAAREERFTLTLESVGGSASAVAPAATITLPPLLTSTPDTAAPIPTLSPEITATVTPSTAGVVIPFDGPCVVTPSGSQGVNIRSGPSGDYAIVGGLGVADLMLVIARDESRSWWQIEYRSGFYGWVAASAVQYGGDCSAVGVAFSEVAPEISITQESE